MCSQKLCLIVEKGTRLNSESKKHVEICRFGAVMLHQVQFLIESLVSKRKVHFRAGWKFFVFFIKICYFCSNEHFQEDTNFDESSILK